jgi:hypothetical protein
LASVRESIENAVRYLSEHPDEARYTDSFARATLGKLFYGGAVAAAPRAAPVSWKPMARLEDYRFGHVVVDGQEETRDIIVLPGRVIRNWWRKDGHALVLDDLGDVLDELPERLVVGTGATGQMEPDPGTVKALRERGVEVEMLRTHEAVRRYAAADPARTAAALHLTC